MRTCEACGAGLEGRRPQARFCDGTCRQRGARRLAPPNRGTAEDVAAPIEDGGLLEALRRELKSAGRLDTALGQQALALAVKLASPHDTGSAMAAVSRELRAVREEALRGAGQDASPLSRARDELAARRTRRSA